MRRKREGMSEAQWKLNMVAVIVLMIVYLIVTLYNSERLAAQTGEKCRAIHSRWWLQAES